MNHETTRENKITEFPICQFYIVLNHEKRFRSDKKNKYFPVSGNEDINLIQYAVKEEYKKKRKEGYAVAGEIIFIIPSPYYKNQAEELMDKLNFRGTIKIVPIEVKKEKVKPVIKEKKEEPKEEIKEEIKEEKQVEDLPEFDVKREQPQIIEEITDEFQPVRVKTNSYLPKDNVFHGDFSAPTTNLKSKEEKEQTAAEYMGWNEKKLVKKRKKEDKSKKTIDLPIIVFILSALLLIGAVILLFILK